MLCMTAEAPPRHPARAQFASQLKACQRKLVDKGGQ
jgi:hypothetical protein